MILILAAVLAVAWLMGFLVFHVASTAIHILLVIAVLAVVAHFVRGVGGMRKPVGRIG